jgi:hypothetical protein
MLSVVCVPCVSHTRCRISHSGPAPGRRGYGYADGVDVVWMPTILRTFLQRCGEGEESSMGLQVVTLQWRGQVPFPGCGSASHAGFPESRNVKLHEPSSTKKCHLQASSHVPHT